MRNPAGLGVDLAFFVAQGVAEEDVGLQTVRGHFDDPTTKNPGNYIEQIQVGTLSPPDSVTL